VSLPDPFRRNGHGVTVRAPGVILRARREQRSMATTFTKPDIPEILTRRSWDKNKGVIAKMAGQTGIGAQCDKVAAAYKMVKWEKFDLPARRAAVLQNWRDDTFTRGNWTKLLNEAGSEVQGNLTKLSQELYKLRDLCLKTAADFKKSKAIPSSSVQHVEKMAKAADFMGVRLNKNSMGGVLKSMNEEFLAEVKLKFIDPMWPGIRKYATQHANLMAELRRNPDPKALNNDGRTACRDIQTGLGNIAKLGERGFGPKNPEAQSLFTQLAVWGNAPGHIVDDSASAQVVLAELDKIEPVFKKALQFIASSK
jgi:hypothetical protein